MLVEGFGGGSPFEGLAGSGVEGEPLVGARLDGVAPVDSAQQDDGDVERLQELPGLRAPVRQLRTPCDVTRSGVTPGPPPRPRSAGVPPRPGRSSSAGGIGEQWKCHIFQTGFPSPSSRW